MEPASEGTAGRAELAGGSGRTDPEGGSGAAALGETSDKTCSRHSSCAARVFWKQSSR